MSTNTSSNTPATTAETLFTKVNEAAKYLETIPPFNDKNWLAANKDLLAEQHGEFTVEGVPLFIVKRLMKLGIYLDTQSHELLVSDDCTEGEARRIFCENGEPNLPPVRFKRLWSILKGSSVVEVQKKNTVAQIFDNGQITAGTIQEIVKAITDNNKPIGQWTDEELLKAYNPECDGEVTDTLEKRAQHKAFIIFEDENQNKVDIQACLSMLRQARKGKTPVHYKVGTSLKRLYKAGHFPATTLYECPIHPSIVLLDDGFCDECGLSWNLDNYEAMQFARIIYELGEVPQDKAYLRQFVNDCSNGKLEELAQDYPKAWMIYKERKAADDLPRLKRRTSIDNRVKSDPMTPSVRY